MLSDRERNQLQQRESLSSEIRAVNDYRAKKKLIKWLESAPDALIILQNIPVERLKDDLSDIDVYRLLEIAKNIMWARKFMAINGELGEPDKWEAEGYDIVRPADVVDVGRASFLSDDLDIFRQFIGPKNPVLFARQVARILDDTSPDNTWKDRFTHEEKAGAKRAVENTRDYLINMIEGAKGDEESE